jgi:hypothetical protein
MGVLSVEDFGGAGEADLDSMVFGVGDTEEFRFGGGGDGSGGFLVGEGDGVGFDLVGSFLNT